MKSKQSELTQYNNSSGMSCRGCVFAESEDENQTGCAANRMGIFLEEGAHKPDGDTYYRIPRFCNMYRERVGWAESDQTAEELLEKATYEAQPLFGIALRDDPERPFSDLEKTVESILKLDYDKDKIKTVISSFPGRGLSAVAHLVNVMKDAGNQHSSCIFHVMHESKVKDTEIFKKLVQGHYFVNVQAGTLLQPDLFNIVDESLNTKLERIFLFEGDGFSVASKSIVTKMYLDFNNYQETIDSIRNLIIRSKAGPSGRYVYL